MRKKHLLLICVIVFIIVRAHAQDGSNNLTLPSSPAFSILNFEPSSVMKPADYKDLSTDVLNSFDKSGKLLMNLGLEVSPYWLQSHPTLTRQEYLNPSLLHIFLQSFSISVATVKDSASGANNLGVGFRFRVLNGKPVPQQDTVDRQLRRSDKIISIIAAAKVFKQNFPTLDSALGFISKNMVIEQYSKDTVNKIVNLGKKIESKFKGVDDSVVAFLDTLQSIVDTEISSLAQRTATITQQRKGFILEFAGASAFNTSQSNEVTRVGFWSNLSNYVSQTDLFTLTLRYMYHSNDTSVSNFDAGLSYMKKKGKYNFSLEYMIRWSNAKLQELNNGTQMTISQSDFSYRLAFQASYMLSSQISVNVSLGKDFDTPYITSSGFFSLLGFNYSIFNNDKLNPSSR